MPDESYTVPEDVLTAHLRDEAVLLHIGTKNYHSLNATAAFLWKQLEAGASRAELLEALCARFEVERAEAEGALERLLGELEQRQLIRIGPAGELEPR